MEVEKVLVEVIKFLLFAFLIVLISKYILVSTLRRLAESINLKAKTVGNITGAATSVPELLTITTSSLRGLQLASIYNILSSNIINLVLFLGTVFLNKNVSKLKNRVIIFDLVLVGITILIPIILLRLNIELDIFIVPLFIIFYALFSFLNNSVHKYYLNKDEEDNNNEKIQIKRAIIYSCILIVTVLIIYIIGDLLGNTLEKLCNIFSIPQFLIGILLGFITSIPELITFFESQKYNKKEKNEMIGVVEATNNLLTSNILNLFVIQTIGILIINR